jgi:hypothetical protein
VKLGLWSRLGISLTALWVLFFSVMCYLSLSAAKAEQIRLANLICDGKEPSCRQQYTDWVVMSDPALVGVSIAIAFLIAALFWAGIGAVYITIKWIIAGRKT